MSLLTQIPLSTNSSVLPVTDTFTHTAYIRRHLCWTNNNQLLNIFVSFSSLYKVYKSWRCQICFHFLLSKQLWQNVKRFNQYTQTLLVFYTFNLISQISANRCAAHYVNDNNKNNRNQLYIQFIFSVTYLSNHGNNLMWVHDSQHIFREKSDCQYLFDVWWNKYK